MTTMTQKPSRCKCMPLENAIYLSLLNFLMSQVHQLRCKFVFVKAFVDVATPGDVLVRLFPKS